MATKFSAIDQLGIVKAQIAALAKREKALADRVKEELLTQGVQSAEGVLFRATLVVASRVCLDTTAAKKLLPVEVYPHLYSSDVVESLRVVARVARAA
jgi:hypothetical protein